MQRFYGHVVVPVADLAYGGVADIDVTAVTMLLNYFAAIGCEVIEAGRAGGVFRWHAEVVGVQTSMTDLAGDIRVNIAVSPAERFTRPQRVKIPAGLEVVALFSRHSPHGDIHHKLCMSTPAACLLRDGPYDRVGRPLGLRAD